MKTTKKALCAILAAVILATVCLMTLTACDSPTLDRDYSFEFDPLKTTVWNIPGIPVAFTQDSGLKISKDGTLTIDIKINPKMLEVFTGDLDLSFLVDFDIGGIADAYAVPLVPWFEMEDIQGSFEAMKESLGGELILDYDSDEVKKMVESIQTTGHLNPDFKIPSTLGLRYSGKYTVKKLVSADGTEYTALYIDKYSEGGEPFFIMTLGETEEGRTTARLRVEFLQMTLFFVEIEE